MQWFETVTEYLKSFGIYTGTMNFGDVLEILIITFLVYVILDWMQATRAWTLMKGLLVIAVFLLLAVFLEMNTIVWIAKNVLGFAVTALIIVMQPELRNALEALGKKNFLLSLGFSGSLGKEKEVLSEKTINEIVDAAVAMSKVKTGALIVIEQKESLQEYEKTGIEMDAVVSSQLLENIFEHNTPLHDGAVLIRGNRVASATCYLPLSKNQALSKDLGTRHRAAVGVSEQTDSMTIVVSEETGKISLAVDGVLERGIAPERLKKRLKQSLNKRDEDEAQGKTKKRIWRGKARQQDEEDIA